eukprot:1326988-Amorphochlora_amoeboformis.AAC.1
MKERVHASITRTILRNERADVSCRASLAEEKSQVYTLKHIAPTTIAKTYHNSQIQPNSPSTAGAPKVSLFVESFCGLEGANSARREVVNRLTASLLRVPDFFHLRPDQVRGSLRKGSRLTSSATVAYNHNCNNRENNQF